MNPEQNQQQAQNPMMNPMMMQMMQMMQMMGGMGQNQMMDPSAVPFAVQEQQEDEDKGLEAGILQPYLLEDLLKEQKAVKLGNVFDYLCLTSDRKNALGGMPMGCTIAVAGPPGKGKTRSMMSGMARVAASGTKVAYVVAEEGFYNDAEAGREDLCSRMVRIGMQATGISDLKKFKEKVLKNMYVLESQYHRGQSWDDFVAKYRYLIEKEGIKFVIVDSLNMLDPSRNRTADNLSALKTYNHEKGITCLCIGQIKDTGGPVGGESLQHTADAVFLIEELGLTSKELAEKWGGSFRDRIDVIRAVKSVTTPIFQHPIRLATNDNGELIEHADQPKEFATLKIKE